MLHDLWFLFIIICYSQKIIEITGNSILNPILKSEFQLKNLNFTFFSNAKINSSFQISYSSKNFYMRLPIYVQHFNNGRPLNMISYKNISVLEIQSMQMCGTRCNEMLITVLPFRENSTELLLTGFSSYNRIFNSNNITNFPITYSKSIPLTILNLNLWNYNQFNERLTTIIETLKQNTFDIIGLQEVRCIAVADVFNRSTTDNNCQIAEILEKLNKEYQFYVYYPAHCFQETRTSVHCEGLAIISKYPIISYHVIQLPRNKKDTQDQHQRICLHAIIQIPISDNNINEYKYIHFLVTHLSLSEKSRKKSISAIGKYINSIIQSEGTPDSRSIGAILTGDFNSNNISLLKYNLNDAWLFLNKQNSNNEGNTFDHWDPKKRIDYIFFRNANIDSDSIKLLDIIIDNHFLSDHKAIIAKFVI